MRPEGPRARRGTAPPPRGLSFDYPGGIFPVRVLSRPNRFLVRVRFPGGPTAAAHLPNPGRLRELLTPGVRGHVWLRPRRAPPGGRRTGYTLVDVRAPAGGRGWVSVDTQLARVLVERALSRGLLPPLDNWGLWTSEVRWGAHRFDHAVVENGRTSRPSALLEVKSSNLREGRTALFPDAPTVRGTGHVEALTRFVRSGGRAALLFLVQRSDVSELRPYGAMDPAFARAVERARRAGVRLLARSLRVHPGGAAWGRELPVRAPRWEAARDLNAGDFMG